MKQSYYFVSDIEIGGGDLMDDFSDDEIFADYLQQISSRNSDNKVTLVLNGDIMDFLKMTYKDGYPRHITEEISSHKLERMIASHPLFFRAIANFLKNPNNNVAYIIGNHDADIIWPSLQERIKKEIQNGDNISFGYFFDNEHLHAEHGHLSDTLYKFNHRKPFYHYKNKQLLNLSFGAHMCFEHFNDLKRRFPKIEQLYPKPLVLNEYPDFMKAVYFTATKLVLKSMILNPILKFYDPAYKAPHMRIARHLWRHGADFTDDEKFVKHIIKRTIRKNPGKKIYILGHSHLHKQMEKNQKKVFVTDTWRDEFDITQNMKKPKSYALIELEDNKLVSSKLDIF